MHRDTSSRNAPRGLWVVAQKEFADHLTNPAFLVLSFLLILVCIVPFQQGLDNYDSALALYADPAKLAEFGPEGSVGGGLAAEIYSPLHDVVSTAGAILAIAMGFDLVSRERQTGSLKLLLARPVFRDEIITGKVLGGVAALTAVTAAGLALSVAVLLFRGIVPGADDLVSVLLFGLATVALLAFYFCLALTISAVAGESGKAFLYALVAFFILSTLVPVVGSEVRNDIAGSYSDLLDHADHSDRQSARETYEERMTLIDSVVTVFSPQMNYKTVVQYCLNPRITEYQPFRGHLELLPAGTEAHPLDALARCWQNVLVLVLAPIALFGLAFLAFLRMDIR
ncbi:ABC transporter permease [uncultured Methanofollis sp.]|uniref:ABC transporter permease n=1 Tax=uncultured Methanofollis sp. TaxID=262500 RepID=UPI002631CC6B|nr:ABC transporter permease subunit [uncultured Methanofollis sp.]